MTTHRTSEATDIVFVPWKRRWTAIANTNMDIQKSYIYTRIFAFTRWNVNHSRRRINRRIIINIVLKWPFSYYCYITAITKPLLEYKGAIFSLSSPSCGIRDRYTRNIFKFKTTINQKYPPRRRNDFLRNNTKNSIDHTHHTHNISNEYRIDDEDDLIKKITLDSVQIRTVF